jgi:hypothetical protein
MASLPDGRTASIDRNECTALAILSELQERLLLEILAELNVLSIVDIHSGNYYGPGRG